MKKIYSVLAALCVFAACTPETEQPVQPGEKVLSPVTFSAQSTKTALGGIDGDTQDVLWKEGDVVKIYYGETASDKGGDFEVHTVQASEISNDGKNLTFTVMVGGAPYYAIAGQIDGGKVSGEDGIYTVDFASDGTWGGADIIAAYTANAAAGGECTQLQFKHLASQLEMQMDFTGKIDEEDYISTVSFETEDHKFYGSYDVYIGEGLIEAEAGDSTATGVVFDLSADQSKSCELYIPFVPCNEAFDHFFLTATMHSGRQFMVKNKGFEAAAGNVIELSDVTERMYEVEKIDGVIGEHFNSNASSDVYSSGTNLSDDYIGQYANDWEYNNAYVFKNGIRIGTGSNNGSLTSANILSAIPTGTKVSVKVFAAKWNTDKATLTLKVGDETVDTKTPSPAITNTGNEYSKGDFTSTTDFEFEKEEGVNSLTLSAYKRVIIDSLAIIYSASQMRLKTPQNLAVNEKTVSWSPVKKAGSYIVTVNGTPAEVTDTTFACELADDFYDVSVVAVPSDHNLYVNSEAATLQGAKFGTPRVKLGSLTKEPSTPTSVSVSWTIDELATSGFICWLTDSLGKDILAVKDNVTEDCVTFDGLTSGASYRIYVKAHAAGLYEESIYRYSNVMTAVLKTFASINATGAAYVKNATVAAILSGGIYALDATGGMSITCDTEGLEVGDVVDVSGNISQISNVEHFYFSNANVTPASGQAVAIAEPTVVDGNYFNDENLTFGQFVSFSGQYVTSYSRVKVDGANKYPTLYSSIHTEGLQQNDWITVKGFTVYRNSSGYVQIATRGIVKHTLTADAEELDWADDETDTKTVNVSVEDGADWSFAPASDENWDISRSGNVLSVSPKAANTAKTPKILSITVSHNVIGALTKTIDLKQNGALVAAPGETLWFEDFADEKTDGTYSIGGVSVTEVLTNGVTGITTKLYSDKLAGGTSPELLIAKSGGSLAIYGIPTAKQTEMILSFLCNGSADIEVSSTPQGVTAKKHSEGNVSPAVYIITAPSTIDAFDLLLKNTSTGNNRRVDDIRLKVKASCETPVISFENNIVTISCATEDVPIYYTLDGSTPTTESAQYSEPIKLTETKTVKAVAGGTAEIALSEVAEKLCEYAKIKLTMSEIQLYSVGADQLVFAWEDVENASGYKVSVDGGNTYGEAQDATTYTWTGLTVGQTKTIHVKAAGTGEYEDSDAKTCDGTTTSKIWTVESISVTTAPSKTEYELGDALDLAGIVVSAHLTNNQDSETQDIPYTSNCSFSPASGTELSTAGDNTVTVTLTSNPSISCTTTVQVKAAVKTWTYNVSKDSPTFNKTSSPITIKSAAWSIAMGETVGSPTNNGTVEASNKKDGWKWGNSKSAYWKSYTLSTDYFTAKKVKSVTVNFLNNGSKAGTMTVIQGTTTIGSSTKTFGQTWTDLSASARQGTSGTLTIQYSVDQASSIHSITVEYFD